jgi:hypothetical protein
MRCQYRFGDTECLNYQMFTQKKYVAQQWVTVSILSGRSAVGESRRQKQELN